MLIPAVSILLLAAALTFVSLRLGHAPEPPRDYLYEAEGGQRENPFGDLSEGAADGQSRCRACGDGVESSAYRVCQTCVTRPLSGD